MIIFEIESPGGYLIQSQNLASAIADLADRNVRTVAYIPKTAYSGAAMIALACDEIYLHPHAFIGDIGVIQSADGQAFEFAPEKFLSPVRAFLRGVAGPGCHFPTDRTPHGSG